MATVSDNFDRADSTSLGANWAEDSGDWAIVSNVLRQSTAGGSYRKCRWVGAALASADHYSQAICASDDVGNGAGVFVRGIGSSAVTYYAILVFGGDSDYMVEITAGSENILDTGAGRADGAYTLKLQANGASLSGSVNGAASTSASDASLASGSVGVMSYAVINSAANYINTWEAADLAASGSAYTDSLTLARAGALTDSGLADANPASTFARSNAVTDSGLAVTSGSAALARAGAVSSSVLADVNQSLSLARAGALSHGDQADANTTSSLTYTQSLTGGGLATTTSSATLARADAQTQTDIAGIATSQTLALSRALSYGNIAGVVTTLTLADTIAAALSASAAGAGIAGLTYSLTLDAISGSQAAPVNYEVSVAFDHTLTITATAQSAAASSAALGRSSALSTTDTAAASGSYGLALSQAAGMAGTFVSQPTLSFDRLAEITLIVNALAAAGVSLDRLQSFTPGVQGYSVTVAPERTLTVGIYPRTLTVDASPRTLAVEAYTRILSVPAQARTYEVSDQSRTLTA